MRFVNRGMILVFPREPYVEWANDVSEEGHEFDPSHAMPTAYLIPEFETLEEVDAFVRDHYGAIFEEELAAWRPEPEDWPDDRGLDEFWEWFGVDFTAHVADLAGPGTGPESAGDG